MSLEQAVGLAESAGWIDTATRCCLVGLARQVPFQVDVLLEELGVDPELAARWGAESGVGDFGRYQVLRCLGEGGMGSVFLAQDRQLGRKVALKLMHTTLQSERQRRRFQREAAVMARIDHPACVEVYDVGVTGRGEPFLVMEYVEGRNLQEVLRQEGPPEQRRVARWGRDLAEALEACHKEGVLHRDVKPSNILLTPEGNVRLTDFGVAHDAQAHTQLTQGAVGTLLYMAPELLDGAAPTSASEVYALGATLYELLSGGPPFPGPSHLELLRQVAGTEPPTLVPIGVHPDLDQILLKCLAKDPQERYDSAREAGLDFGRLLAGAAVVARPRGLAQRTLRYAWRHRRAISLAVAASALGAGAFLLTNRWKQYHQGQSAAARMGRAADLLSPSAAARDLDLADRLLDAARPFLSQQDRAKAEDLSRRSTGLRLLLAAREQFGSFRTVARELMRLSQPIEYLVTDSSNLEMWLARQVEGSKIRGDCYAGYLRSYVEVDRLVQAAAHYLEPGDSRDFRGELESLAGAAVSEFWPEEAEVHFRRARSLGVERGDSALPVVRVDGNGNGYLTTEAGERLEFALPTTLNLEALRYKGLLSSPGAVPFRVAISLRRGEQRVLRPPVVVLAEVPPILRDSLVAVLGGRPRFGVHLRRAKESVPSFLMLKTEVTREMALSFLLYASGRRDSKGTPLLSVEAMREIRNPRYGSPGIRAPCVGLNWPDCFQMLRWLEREFLLVGAHFRIRLPTPLEYHQAVRSDYLWLFPWGKDLDPAQFFDGRSDAGSDSRDVSPYGIRDLGASVREFCFVWLDKGRGGLYQIGSRDGAEYVSHLVGSSEAFGVAGRAGLDRGSGFRFVVQLTDRPKYPWKVSLPRSLELQEVARDLLSKRQFQQARYTATDALRAYRKNVEAWTIRAEARLAIGDAWGAWWDCAQVLELDPDHDSPRLWSLYARAVTRSERWEKAIPLCTKALSYGDDDPGLYFYRGWAHLESGQQRKAISDLGRHLELMPESPNRARALGLLKRAQAELAGNGQQKQEQKAEKR